MKKYLDFHSTLVGNILTQRETNSVKDPIWLLIISRILIDDANYFSLLNLLDFFQIDLVIIVTIVNSLKTMWSNSFFKLSKVPEKFMKCVLKYLTEKEKSKMSVDILDM